MEATLKSLLLEYHQWAYVIVFFWCILEGEMALILCGIMAHEGHINLGLGVFVAGLGAFVGDQIYFYLGRYSKKYLRKKAMLQQEEKSSLIDKFLKKVANKLIKQRRKIAIAHLLLEKYGWPIIFMQRYLYGFRTVIPISIGITRYDSKKFAIINLISGWCWAGITILLAWYFGNEIWHFISWAEEHWYLAIILVGGFLFGLFKFFKSIENRIYTRRENR